MTRHFLILLQSDRKKQKKVQRSVLTYLSALFINGSTELKNKKGQ